MFPTGADAQAVSVACAALPQLLTAEEIASIRLVNVDVEGAEGCVVRGFSGMLVALPADAEFMLELSATSPGVAAEVFGVLRQHGFCGYQIRNDYSSSAYLNPPMISDMPSFDAVPEG